MAHKFLPDFRKKLDYEGESYLFSDGCLALFLLKYAQVDFLSLIVGRSLSGLLLFSHNLTVKRC